MNKRKLSKPSSACTKAKDDSGRFTSLFIVIPAYNEAEVIGSVLRKIPKRIKGVRSIQKVVVDDGSQDKTGDCSSCSGTIVVRHVLNLGVGAATITGIEYAKSQNADIVVTMDGDGQHNPKDIEKLIKPIISKKADIVIGSRTKCTGKSCDMPWIKKAGNQMMNGMTFIFYRKWISDTQSGFKALSKKALLAIRLSQSGYEICSEIIGEATRNKLRVFEVPVQAIYTEYSKRKGQSILNAINIFIRLVTRGIMGP